MGHGLLIDLDGVIYQGHSVIPGAAETIQWLQQQNIPHLFITNTTSIPRRKIIEKLAGFNINVSEDSILTPPIAACKWLAKHTAGPAALFIPTATLDDFSSIPQIEVGENNASSVVLGDYGENWTFAELNRAFTLLMEDSKPVLVALGMTRYWQSSNGLQLDVGPFIKALEYASGRSAFVLGKPSIKFFETALLTLQCEPKQTFMIGDDIVGDIQGAQTTGINGILVRTGKFRLSDLDDKIRADAIIDSIADLPDFLQINSKLVKNKQH